MHHDARTARTLTKALLISLACHLILLLQDELAIQPATDEKSRQPPLTARLSIRPPQTPDSLPHSTPPAAESPLSTSNTPTRAAQSTRPTRPTRPRQSSQSSRPAAVATTVATAQTTPENSPSPSSAIPADHLNSSADGLRQYRVDLAVAARQFRTYPQAARSAGQGGIAGIRVSVDATGQPQGASLQASSNHPDLDAAALAMLENAARATRVPAILRGQSFDVLISVEFDPRAE
ncbi:MAG: energy transducer TonB [Sterolibacterium sp.]|nr:energy transducer TonB [Sterolibacterium sp.]